jgi:hypothetical protein
LKLPDTKIFHAGKKQAVHYFITLPAPESDESALTGAASYIHAAITIKINHFQF